MNLLDKRLWASEMREEVAEMYMAGVLRGAEVGSQLLLGGSDLVGSAIGDGVRESNYHLAARKAALI